MTRGDLDLIITGLVKLRREVDHALDRAVLAGRTDHDLSWDEVAALTGVTARTAAKRWQETAPAAKDGGAAKDAAAGKNGAVGGSKGRKGTAGRAKAGAATTAG